MKDDIFAVLEDRIHSFLKGQRRIAAYITDAYDKAAFMTASNLGKAVGVSESTVVRFATELGYDGYPSMQKAMQEMVLNRLTSVQRIEVTKDRIGDQDVLSMVLQSDADKLRKTNETVDRNAFQAAIQTILKARRIYICTTFGLFCNGLEVFDKAFEEGVFDRVYTTNLVYRMPELAEKEWYVEVDLSKYISLIIDTLNHDGSLSRLLDPVDRINKLLLKNGFNLPEKH